MKRTLQKIGEGEHDITIITIGCLLIIFIIGGLAGWSVRVVSSRDRYLMTAAEHQAALSNYYNAQANEMILGVRK